MLTPQLDIDKVTAKRMQALKDIEKYKARVASAYNKEKSKSFQVGYLVSKTILLLGTNNKFGKWSPS